MCVKTTVSGITQYVSIIGLNSGCIKGVMNMIFLRYSIKNINITVKKYLGTFQN